MHKDINETDLVVQIMEAHDKQSTAEQRAKFDMAVAAAAAEYKKRCRIRRRVYHWLNQCSMLLAGALGLIVAIVVATDDSWHSLLYVSALAVVLAFSRWCHRKSRHGKA